MCGRVDKAINPVKWVDGSIPTSDSCDEMIYGQSSSDIRAANGPYLDYETYIAVVDRMQDFCLF